jgi:hypothetical protein
MATGRSGTIPLVALVPALPPGSAVGTETGRASSLIGRAGLEERPIVSRSDAELEERVRHQ